MGAILRPVITQDAAGNLLANGRYLPRILGASGVAVSGPADTSENILATITVPAGAMGLNGRLRWEAHWTFTNSANSKTCRVRFGGIGGSAYTSVAFTTTANFRDFKGLANRGASNSQISVADVFGPGSSFGGGTGTVVTSAIDTSAATTLVITGQKASAGETITLESYLVELILL